MVTGSVIPIARSCLRWLPFPKPLASPFSATFFGPLLFGNHHRVAWLNFFNISTRGQSIFIAYLLIISIVLCSMGYDVSSPRRSLRIADRELYNELDRSLERCQYGSAGTLCWPEQYPNLGHRLVAFYLLAVASLGRHLMRYPSMLTQCDVMTILHHRLQGISD